MYADLGLWSETCRQGILHTARHIVRLDYGKRGIHEYMGLYDYGHSVLSGLEIVNIHHTVYGFCNPDNFRLDGLRKGGIQKFAEGRHPYLKRDNDYGDAYAAGYNRVKHSPFFSQDYGSAYSQERPYG